MSDPKIIAMDDHRERVIVETESGDRYEYTLDHLERVAAAKASLATIHPDALRCIVAQWIEFIDLIDEFAHDEPGEV